ncbi:tyrosine-protein phosphatase [Vibrio aestuarianus]|nr:tyrosine-protein phosphatase [Vibrio aestuarianus]MDE1236679.1 tyrosine-protein phosphatase [Vibrio aestuarianus]MDE1247569.1 tyrosine-protein phosphatase [Vibrio aestuarianus]
MNLLAAYLLLQVVWVYIGLYLRFSKVMHYQYRGDNIIFNIPIQASNNIFFVGNATNWKVKEDFKFHREGDSLTLIKPKELALHIGNSGYCEYFFWDQDLEQALPFDHCHPQGYFFNNQFNGSFNYLLLAENPSQNELVQIHQASEASFMIKQQREDYSSEESLANFRSVLGGALKPKRLYRSYHPISPSRSHIAELKSLEELRQIAVRKLLSQYQIANIINLSETDHQLKQEIEQQGASYYQQLWSQGCVYSVPMSYETVYFMSHLNQAFNDNELGFQDGIKQIITIIANEQAPFHVHCRLGSDRTGVVIGFLQLFMGATKSDIESNYLLTNQLGIGEYRSFKLLEVALTNALGENCFDDGRQVVYGYLLNLGLEKSMINSAYQKLS